MSLSTLSSSCSYCPFRNRQGAITSRACTCNAVSTRSALCYCHLWLIWWLLVTSNSHAVVVAYKFPILSSSISLVWVWLCAVWYIRTELHGKLTWALVWWILGFKATTRSLSQWPQQHVPPCMQLHIGERIQVVFFLSIWGKQWAISQVLQFIEFYCQAKLAYISH